MAEIKCCNAPVRVEQVEWINACKGLGIYLVVLGHCHINTMLQQFIYVFHMPLFFFLSGYVHTIKADLRRFVSRKSIHLLLPYVSFLVLLYPVHTIGTLRHHGWDHQLIRSALYTALWGGSQLREAYGVFWFLPCLFFTQQVVNVLLLRLRSGVAGCVVAVGLIAAYANARYLPAFNLPLDLHVVLAAMPFFYIGFMVRSGFRPGGWSGGLVKALAAVGTGLTAYLIYLRVPIAYDMRDGVYGVPWLSLILALCCIVSLQWLSQLLIASEPLRRATTRLGIASLGVMFIHKEVMDMPGFVVWSRNHGYISSVLITVISYAITWLLGQLVVARALFLGSERDFSWIRSGLSSLASHWIRRMGKLHSITSAIRPLHLSEKRRG